MRSKIPFLIFYLYIIGSNNLSAKKSIAINPVIDSSIQKVLIINSFDALSMNARKNKKELFSELSDSAKRLIYRNISERGEYEALNLPELLKEKNNKDSIIFQLMDKYSASRAVVINKLDVYFNQTDVEVTKEEDGKKRTAFYDICAVADYSLYNKGLSPKEKKVSLCEFYTKRSVISGFLAAGPDIVGKRKDAFKIITKLLDGHLEGAY